MMPREAFLLGIYLNANESRHGVPLYRAIVERARDLKLAGASVFSAQLSYGAHRQLHDGASEYMSYDMPVIVEIVDAPERVRTMIDALGEMLSEALVVSRSVQVIRYSHAAEQEGKAIRPMAERAEIGDLRYVDSHKRSDTSMRIEGEARRVTVYIGSSDTWHGQNLAVAIVERCRGMGIAGATACRGAMGFGKQSIIHRPHLLALSSDLPEKVEIVDRPEEIARLLPVLDEMVGGGLVVIEDVHVVRYLHDPTASTQSV